MYLLDTNICIYAMRKRYDSVIKKLSSIPRSEILISAVTVFELEYGAAKSKWAEKSRAMMRGFLLLYNVIPFTKEDAEVCGKIRGFLEQHGMPIGFYDVMIGSQGLARNLTVVTHNTEEFSRIPNLKLEDWVI